MTVIITLLVCAFVFFFLEIFVPGGFLAIIGGAFMVGASFVTFHEYGWIPAALLFVFSGLCSFLMFFLEVKLLVKTPWGKRIRLTSRVEGASLEAVDVKDLLNEMAITITPLNPSGRIKVANQLLEATSEDGWMAKGETVKIVGSDVFHVRVRACEVTPVETEI